SSSLTEEAISVVQYARRPGGPIRPNRSLIVFFGAASGLLFFAGLAFLRETFDQRILGSRQLEEVIGDLPILGTIPDVTGDEQYGPAAGLRVFSPTASAGSEAFRSLRANVKFALVGTGKHVVVVTSSRPGE